MTKFWELFRSSVVLQFSLALIVTITICALYLLGRAVPTTLANAWWIILGFTFGQKVQQSIDKNRGKE